MAMSCLFGLFFLLLPWPLSVPHYMSAVSPMQSLSEHPSCPSPTLFLEIPTAIFPSILTFGIMAPATLCLSEASMDKLMWAFFCLRYPRIWLPSSRFSLRSSAQAFSGLHPASLPVQRSAWSMAKTSSSLAKLRRTRSSSGWRLGVSSFMGFPAM